MDAAPTLDSLRMRADIQIAQKKWDDSIVTLNKAIALSPRDAQLHGGLGRIYLQKRDFPDALKELKMALQLDGKNLAYWKDLSTLLLSLRRLSFHAGDAGRNCKNGNAWRWTMVYSSALLR